MSATAGKHNQGAKSSGPQRARPGNIYDRIAEARAKRDAASRPAEAPAKIAPAPETTRASTDAPAFPLDREKALKPLKEKKTPANSPTFPALVDADPPPAMSSPPEADDRGLPKALLWGASALLAAGLIGFLLVRSGPGGGFAPAPVALESPESVTAPVPRPAPGSQDLDKAARLGIAPQSAPIPAIVAPKETAPPGVAPLVTQRPEPPAAGPRPAALPKADPAPVTRDDGSVTAGAAFDAGAYRIVVQAPPSIPEAERQAVVAALGAADLVAEARGVNLSISKSNVRFYYDQDAALASHIAATIAAEARDFTTFRPRPAEGLIEIWLEGRRSRPTAASGNSTAGLAASLRRLQIGLQRALGQR